MQGLRRCDIERSKFMAMAVCDQSSGSPYWWSRVKKWFKSDPCDLPCHLHYDFVCAVRNTSNGREYVLADNACVLENYNNCFGTNYTVVYRGLCRPIKKYIRQPEPPFNFIRVFEG